jgi:hypothetical protein
MKEWETRSRIDVIAALRLVRVLPHRALSSPSSHEDITPLLVKEPDCSGGMKTAARRRPFSNTIMSPLTVA